MRNFLMVTILAAATAAILAAIGSAVWSGSNENDDNTEKRDALNEALANYHSRREYLRNYRPLAGELAKGREAMQAFTEKSRQNGDDDSVQRLEKIMEKIDDDFAKTENLRNECLSDKYVFDEDDFSLDQALDANQLDALAKEVRQATEEIESCIRKLDFDAAWWRREYTLAKIGLKLCPEK